MERTRDTLLLALYALPDPPDGLLINRRARAAVKEEDEGSAASRAEGEGVPSLDAVRANRRMDPVGRKRRGTGGAARDDSQRFAADEPAYGRGLEEVPCVCDGGAPRRVAENCCLDATRKGRGAGTAGERFLKDEGGAHGRLLYRQDLGDRGNKHCGGGADAGSLASCAVNGAPCSRGVSTTAGERFSMEKHRRVCGAEEDGRTQGRFLLTFQDHDYAAKKKGAADGSLASCAVNGAPFIQGTCCRDDHRDPSHGSMHSDLGEPVTHNGWGVKADIGILDVGSASSGPTSQVTHTVCLGFKEEVPCSSNAPAVWPYSHSQAMVLPFNLILEQQLGANECPVPRFADEVSFRPDLGTASQCQSLASTSRFANAVSFRPDLGAAAQCQSLASTSRFADAVNFRPDLGTAAKCRPMASTSTRTDALNFRPGLGAGAAPQRNSVANTCRLADSMNSQADIGGAKRKADTTLNPSSSIGNVESYDPMPELLLCSGEVLSKWRRIWKHSPLIFHDKKLVA